MYSAKQATVYGAAALARGRAPRSRKGAVAAKAVSASPEDLANAAVNKRTKWVETRAELDAAFSLAADEGHLLMLSITSPEVCELGDDPDESSVQHTSLESKMEPCRRIENSLSLVAAECAEVSFVELQGDLSNETRALCKELGVSTFPTFQYYKGYDLLWKHVGASAGAEMNIKEGLLYYGNQGAGGERVNETIAEIGSAEELEDMLAECALPSVNPRGVEIDVSCEKQLTVLDVSIQKDSPQCVHIFPAVMSLAKNTQGAARWARCLADSSPAAAQLAKEMGITSFPSFVFFCDGKVVGTYSGADRMTLVNKVLGFLKANGVRMPEPPPRKRMSTAEAKAIAREKREREKQARRMSGW